MPFVHPQYRMPIWGVASLLFAAILTLTACTDSGDTDALAQADVIMETDFGKVGLVLYKETPKHRENFIKLCKEGFYDGIGFHRVIPGFMVQSGDPRSKDESMQDDGPGYNLPAEVVRGFVHTRGKLAAARFPDHLNPDWESSGSQFYIVTGKRATDSRLDSVESQVSSIWMGKLFPKFREDTDSGEFEGDFETFARQNNYEEFRYTPEQRSLYKTVGGAPWLDQQYSIFGEVVAGMDVVEKIQRVDRDPYDRPLEPVKIIKMTVREGI